MAFPSAVKRAAVNAMQNTVYAPNAQNFSQYVRYARGALRNGQPVNAQGFQQFLGVQPRSPGGGKNSQVPPTPTENGTLNQIPAQPMGRNQLLARMLVK